MLSTENVNLIYNEGTNMQKFALKEVSISFRPGCFYGILGPSGSGKSSLLYVLSGIKMPSSGRVFFNKIDYHTLDNKSLSAIRACHFGFIFQRHFLLEYLSVFDNVLVPVNSRSAKHMQRARELLEALGLKDVSGKMPYQLSGGQCQRAAIARALINEPEIVFADEITASLDHVTAFEVMKVLKTFCSESMLIVVTHDSSILAQADEIINIWDGRIVDVSVIRGESL